MDLTRRTLSENSSMAEEPKMRTAYAEQKLFVIYLAIRCAFTGCLSALYFFLLLILLFFFLFIVVIFYLFLISLLLFVIIPSYEVIFLLYYLFFKLGHQLYVTAWPELSIT